MVLNVGIHEIVLETTNHYVAFAKKYGLMMTGGSDCHQKPILMGTVANS